MLSLLRDPFFSDFHRPLARQTSQVSDLDGSYTITIEVPGCRDEDIEVSLKDDTLSVTAKRYDMTLSRSYSVPDMVDQEAISAKAERGLLTITLPKLAEKRIARKIPVLTS